MDMQIIAQRELDRQMPELAQTACLPHGRSLSQARVAYAPPYSSVVFVLIQAWLAADSPILNSVQTRCIVKSCANGKVSPFWVILWGSDLARDIRILELHTLGLHV